MSSSLIGALCPHLPADLDVPAYIGEHEQRNLVLALGAVPDPRGRRGVRYRLASLLAVAVCAVLAGASTFAAIADWAVDLDPPARRRLGLLGRIPAGSTVWRFLVRVDATVLQAVLTGWLRRRTSTPPAGPGQSDRVVIAVDGKLLRGARLPAGRQMHLLSAYDTATGMVLAQVCVEAKSNELLRPRAAFWWVGKSRGGWPGRRRGILVRVSPRMSLARGHGAGALDCCP